MPSGIYMKGFSVAKCTGCNGNGKCNVCSGTGRIRKKAPGGQEHQCPSCAVPGKGVCRVCRGSGVNPPVK